MPEKVTRGKSGARAQTTETEVQGAPTASERADRANWVCEQLDIAYGRPEWRPYNDPLGTLVATILSQRTTDVNSDRAYDTLRRTYPDWDAVRNASVEGIQQAIAAAGLSEVKAPRIKAILGEIHEKQGETRLDFLYDTPTEEAKEYLLSFHGVGPKTAACVLMFSLGRPVLPVDTHVFRVSHRVGLIDEKIGEARAHDALEALLKPEQVYPYHVHLIRHGRRVCVAQGPHCEVCVLQERCRWFAEHRADRREPARGRSRRVKAGTPDNGPETMMHGLPMAAPTPDEP